MQLFLQLVQKRPLEQAVALINFSVGHKRIITVTSHKELDGGTRSSENFVRLVGKQLKTCKQLDVGEFKEESPPKITIGVSDLSCDQKYFFNILKDVRSDSVSTHLAS